MAYGRTTLVPALVAGAVLAIGSAAIGDAVLPGFPEFKVSETDRVTFGTETAADGTLKLSMRGEAFDARRYLRSVLAALFTDQAKTWPPDVDIDIGIASVGGSNGTALRDVELALSRRAGHTTSFAVAAKLGPDATLTGSLRRQIKGRQTVYLESNDAGTLLRFTDTYARLAGGRMWMATDLPLADQAVRDGVLTIRDFSIRGEPSLDRVARAARGAQTDAPDDGVPFSRLHVEFRQSSGRIDVRDGILLGPILCMTFSGHIDYELYEVKLRGLLVAAAPPLPMPFLSSPTVDQVPLSFEVVGSTRSPILRVNPIPLLLTDTVRKLFRGDRFTDPDTPP